MGPEHKRAWKCQACRCNMPKQDNTNTPVRSADENNITLRRKATSSQDQNAIMSLNLSVDEQMQHDESVHGDTINISNNHPQDQALPQTTLDQLCRFLTEKLDSTRSSIINEIKAVLQQEITSTISSLKTDFSQRTDDLANEQRKMQSKIDELNKKILTLETQLNNLHNQTTTITATKPENKINPPAKELSVNNNSKKIVLHGLDEYYGETEANVYDRIVQMFYELLNVNIDGYVEQLTRIGRRGHQRPLEIEFIGKRITKSLLEQSHYLRGTQYTITEYMTAEELRKRREIRKILQEARAQGKYAVIKNNKLYINGEEYVEKESKDSNHNSNNNNNNNANKNSSNNNNNENATNNSHNNNNIKNNNNNNANNSTPNNNIIRNNKNNDANSHCPNSNKNNDNSCPNNNNNNSPLANTTRQKEQAVNGTTIGKTNQSNKQSKQPHQLFRN